MSCGAITLLGISGGFYIVPLYAMMQAYSPRSHRARVVAANNILNAVFMVSSAIFSILILSILKIDLKILFSIIIAVLSAVFTLWLLLKLKPMLDTAQDSSKMRPIRHYTGIDKFIHSFDQALRSCRTWHNFGST